MSNAAHLVRGIGVVAIYYVTPFLLEDGMRISAQSSSLVLVAAIGTSMLFLVPSGILSDRTGTTPLEAAGLALQAVAFAMLAFAGATLSLRLVIVTMIVFGLGSGLFESPNFSAVMGSAPKESLGAAGGVFYTMETIGAFMGIAFADDIMGRWLTYRGTDSLTVPALQVQQFEAAIRYVFLMAFCLVIVGLVITLAKYKLKPRPAV
jgi:MFS family permease